MSQRDLFYCGDANTSEQLAMVTIDGGQYPAADSTGLPIFETAQEIEEFWLWYAGSALTDLFGRALLVYHGSPANDIVEFSTGDMASGIFFSSDERVAATYIPTDVEGQIYSAYLRAERVADLNDFGVFDEVSREAIAYTECRDVASARRFAALLFDDFYGKFSPVTAFFYEMDGLTDLCDRYSAYDLLCDELVDTEAIVDLVKRIDVPLLSQSFEKLAPLISIELGAAREAYGTKEFNLRYQDDFIRAAHRLGYGGVTFNDVSSTASATTYVVFDPAQIRIARLAFDYANIAVPRFG